MDNAFHFTVEADCFVRDLVLALESIEQKNSRQFVLADFSARLGGMLYKAAEFGIIEKPADNAHGKARKRTDRRAR